MSRIKFIATMLLAATLLFAQVGVAAAAPSAQETTSISGTIETITTETDANGVTTVLVKLLDGQTVRISVDTAASLGLLQLDPVTGEPLLDPITGEPLVDGTKVGLVVEIDPTAVIPEEEEDAHPISAILASFFGEDPSVVDGYHEDGFGFGVIAQALWMSKNLNDDASLAGLILEAKESGDYSAFILPDGSTPANWGQFKKAVSNKKNNLGVVVSGHANEDETTDASTQQEHGNSKNKDKGKGHGNGKNNNHP